MEWLLNLDFLHEHLPTSWFENMHHTYELTDEDIVKSVQEASNFFNMDEPAEIHEGWTTGVLTGLSFTADDDILVFNREQLYDLGINDKETFDLVMTHEGAHRALQSIAEENDYTSHQEELCCDYMAGVRAGLNGMDEGKMIASLENTPESATHPGGVARVHAVEAGVAFANDYIDSHNGKPPTFSDCLDYFEKSDIYIKTLPYTEQINLTQEGMDTLNPHVQMAIKGFTQADVDWYEHQARISHGSEQAHWLKEAQWARDHIKGFTQADVDWYEHQARISHGSEQAHWLKEAQWARDHIHSFVGRGGTYGNATGDYWDDSHPTDWDDEHPTRRLGGIRAFTQADVDWYEHQARITSGSEQIHWLKEAQWARNHIHNFVPFDPAESIKEFGRHTNIFESGFDKEHPLPTYDQLRNAGFSDYLAKNILQDGPHAYSQRELYHCLYESDDPVKAYNEMMEAKVNASIAKSDKLIQEIENEFGIKV